MEIVKATVKNFQRHFIVCGLLALAFMSPNWLSPDTTPIEREPVAGSYAHVISNNVCDETVEGEFPTGAIVRKVGGGYFFTENPKMIGKALDEEFADKDWPGFEIRAFCR